MMTIVTGVPGSGKTYWAAYMVWKMADPSKVLHNIDSMKLGTQIHEMVAEKKLGRTVDLFRHSWHEQNDDLHGWTIIIDEAQMLFPKMFKETDIIAFFDKHRHFGMDIILLSQDARKLCGDITCLAEMHYRAASGASNPIPGVLLYQQMIGNEAAGRKFLPKKKQVFNIYRSANNDGSSRSYLGKIYIAIAIIATIGAGFALVKWFDSFKPKVKPEVAQGSETRSNPISSAKSNSPATLRPNQAPSNAISKALGGHPFPISTITDYSGKHYVIAGMVIRAELFPWKIVKSRTGEHALLPDDVYAEVQKYQQGLESTDKKNSLPLPTATEEAPIQKPTIPPTT